MDQQRRMQIDRRRIEDPQKMDRKEEGPMQDGKGNADAHKRPGPFFQEQEEFQGKAREKLQETSQ